MFIKLIYVPGDVLSSICSFISVSSPSNTCDLIASTLQRTNENPQTKSEDTSQYVSTFLSDTTHLSCLISKHCTSYRISSALPNTALKMKLSMRSNAAARVNEKLEGPILPNESDPSHLDTDEKIARRPSAVPIYNEVELVSETEMSFGQILKGTAGKPMTNFEKKAALINAEMDKFGMGRYQICIWFLCGFGYFLDLAWSQGVGLIATAIYQEMGVAPGNDGNIWACANAGLAIGAFSWGIIVDVIGRRWAFNLTCLITSIFGLLLAAPKYNYGAICGIYFLASLGLGGNIPIDATIALEFLPQSRRNLVALLSLWQPIGVVAASGIAYGTAAKYRCDTTLLSCHAVSAGTPCCTVASNMGWRYEVIVLGGLTLVIFGLRFFAFPFHESPKFLISRGRGVQNGVEKGLHEILEGV